MGFIWNIYLLYQIIDVQRLRVEVEALRGPYGLEFHVEGWTWFLYQLGVQNPEP